MEMNINYDVVMWIRSYLTDRTQYVEINGNKSNQLKITSGVPQGSVLGPLLFLVYINDIAHNISNDITIRLFADDCLLYREINNQNDQASLSQALKAVEVWAAKSKMKINESKSVMLRVTNKTKHVIECNYEMNSTILTEAETIKYLGLTISKDLSWKSHIDRICGAAEKKLWFLRRKLKLATTPVKLLAYLTYIRPTLEYASVIWDPFQSGLINRIEKIQRKSARFILSRYYRTDSVSEMLRLLDLPPLAQRRKLARLKFLFCYQKATSILKPHPILLPGRLETSGQAIIACSQFQKHIWTCTLIHFFRERLRNGTVCRRLFCSRVALKSLRNALKTFYEIES